MQVTITRGFHKGKRAEIRQTNPETNEMLVMDEKGMVFTIDAWELFVEVDNGFFDIHTGNRLTSQS